MSADARLFSPSAARNRAPILAMLRRHLPVTGLVLEIASGTGEHAVHLAAALPGLVFQPTDPGDEARASIAAWAAESGLPNIRPPLALDATDAAWPIESADAVLCINMLHIAPWAAAVGLVTGAVRVLGEAGMLVLYGPFHRGGRPTGPGNAAFDADLRARNPAWGLRDVQAVTELAISHGFVPPVIEAMPADNLMLVLRRQGPEGG